MSLKKLYLTIGLVLAVGMQFAGTVPVKADMNLRSTVAPTAAKDLIATATAEAKASNKAVFIKFTASWCIWCRRLSAALGLLEIQKPFSENFVFLELDVLERGEKEALENPGGEDYLKQWGGENAGLPYCVILDKKGKKVADSNQMPNQKNIGYPGSDEEIKAFLGFLKKGAPRLTEAQQQQISSTLKKIAPK
ncbi:MAG: thioredoxin family protein [Acidobacteria bacterium]|nr:thioredoxin family protein [Acidobacteriota bacterium]